MKLSIFKSKIHRTTVTDADLHYDGSGTICINGAGAHLIHKGDIVIIESFASMTQEAKSYKPVVLFVDENNNPQN